MFFFYFLFHFAVAPLPPQGDGRVAPPYKYNDTSKLHLYPRKGTEGSLLVVMPYLLMLHLYPRKGTEGAVNVKRKRVKMLHLYPRKGTEFNCTVNK